MGKNNNMKKLIIVLFLIILTANLSFAEESIEDQIQKTKIRGVSNSEPCEAPSGSIYIDRLGSCKERLADFCEVPIGSNYALDNLKFERIFGEYTVCIYRHCEQCFNGLLQVFKNDSVVFSDHNYAFHVAQDKTFAREEAADVDRNFPELGQDITRDGEPNLIVYTWTGGAHGAHSAYVFSLGEKFGVVNAGKGDVGWAHFEDFDGDDVMEFVAIDKNFEYWNAGYANSPFPKVIRSYKDGEYRFSVDLMKKPLPTAKELDERVTDANEAIERALADEDKIYWRDGNFFLPAEGPWFMLEYIYSGNVQIAWEYFDRIWPEGVPGKEKYLADFKEQLTHSDYWEEIVVVYDIFL